MDSGKVMNDLKKLDGVAAYNRQEPSSGDLERVGNAYAVALIEIHDLKTEREKENKVSEETQIRIDACGLALEELLVRDREGLLACIAHHCENRMQWFDAAKKFEKERDGLKAKLELAKNQRNSWIKTALRNDFSMRDSIERDVRFDFEVKKSDEALKEISKNGTK